MMNIHRQLLRALTGVLLAMACATAQANQHAKPQNGAYPAPLPAEAIPNVAKLATPYPPSYAMVHDFAFGSLIDSAFALVDTDTRLFKGMLSAGNFATIDVSMKRQEFYVGETYYSRGTRGDRTDLVTVYNMGSLDRVAEIELPKKRAAIVVNKGATALTASEKFLLVFNLDPGTSVSVVDLDTRKFVSEIPAPGCAMTYATVEHDFFMLCGDGSMLSIDLDDTGAEKSRKRSEPFIDIDADPLSEKSSRIKDTWYFVSFKGDVQPIKPASLSADIDKRWPLATEAERANNWRPAGWHWTAGHPDGNLWVGMTPDGYDGSHKNPASEVWRFDTGKKQRLNRINLQTPALSIDVTATKEPKLLVVNVEGALDVYNAISGEYVHSIYDLGVSPYQVHRMQ